MPKAKSGLKRGERKPLPPGKPWTPQKVRDRIRVALITRRLEHQALGLLEKEQVVKRIMKRDGIVYRDDAGELQYEEITRSIAMTPLQLQAAVALLDRSLPRLNAPQELAHSGVVNAVFRDPTQRPANHNSRPGRPAPDPVDEP